MDDKFFLPKAAGGLGIYLGIAVGAWFCLDTENQGLRFLYLFGSLALGFIVPFLSVFFIQTIVEWHQYSTNNKIKTFKPIKSQQTQHKKKDPIMSNKNNQPPQWYPAISNDEISNVSLMFGTLGIYVGISISGYYILINNTQNDLISILYFGAGIILGFISFALVGTFIYFLFIDPILAYFNKKT